MQCIQRISSLLPFVSGREPLHRRLRLPARLQRYSLQAFHTHLGHRGFNTTAYLRGQASTKELNNDNKTFVVTTPIYYVNAAPHIGCMNDGVVLHDENARKALRHCNISFKLNFCYVIKATGTDEHGLKVQQAAERQGLHPTDFCRTVSKSFKDLFEEAGVEYTDFIRTTEPRHKKAVQAIWNVLVAKGHIYKGEYQGWYCVSDEEFLADAQVTAVTDESGTQSHVSIATGNAVVRTCEENYMFQLSAFADELRKWLETNPEVIWPRNRVEEVRQFLADDLPDLSVSRLQSTLTWGIPVPSDEDNHTIYVWLDALTNYLTVGGYPEVVTPIDTHVIGKDILKFHAIYWPAFLLAAGLPLPRRLVVHGHWTMQHAKMSKSKGNVVDPSAMLRAYGPDPFRFFLLSEGRLHADCDFSEERVVINELANTLGNLQLRCTSKGMCASGTVPAKADIVLEAGDTAMVDAIESAGKVVPDLYSSANFGQGIDQVLRVLRKVNQYFDHNTPWVLSKTSDSDVTARVRLNTVVYVSLEALRVAGMLLQPICPQTAATLLDRLGVPPTPDGTTNGQHAPARVPVRRATTATLAFGVLDGEELGVDRTPLVRKAQPVAST